MGVRINTSFHNKLNPSNIDKIVDKTLTEVTIALHSKCKELSPYDTGKLQKSHSYEVEQDGSMHTTRITNTAHYWSYVEFGTSKMDARGWVRRSFNEVQPHKKFKQKFKAVVRAIR